MFTSAPCTPWSGLQRGSSPRRGPPQTTHWRGDRLQRGVKTHTHDTDGNEHTGGEGGCPPGGPGGSEAASPAGGGSGVSAPPAPPAPPPTGASSVPVRSARAGARRLGPGDDRLLNPLQPLVIIPRLGPVPAASRQEPGRTAGGEGSVVRGHGPQPRRRSSGVTHSSGHRPLVPEDQGPQSTDPGGSREGPSMGCAHPHGTRGKGSGGCGDGGPGPPERARELGALHCSRASDRRWTRRSTDSRP